MSVNSITIDVGGTSYPCIHLPVEMAKYMPPSERESFIDYANADEPACVRVFVSAAQLAAMPSGIGDGTTSVAFTFGGTGFVWPPDGAAPADVSCGTVTAFTLIKKTIVCQALTEPIFELLFVTREWADRRAWFADVPRNLLSEDKTTLIDSTGTPISQTPISYQTVKNDWETAGSLVGFGSLPSSPTAFPLNASLGPRSPLVAIASLLRPLAMVLCYDIWTGTRSVKQLDYTDPGTETTKLIQLSGYSGLSGSGNANQDGTGGSFTPNTITVIVPDADLGYANAQTFSESNPVTTSGGNEPVYVGDHYYSTNKLYTETLSDIAAERGTAYFKRSNIKPRVWMFAGPIKVPLGQTIRRVRITADMGGCSTTVWQHGTFDVNRETLEDLFSFGRTYSGRFPESQSGYGNRFVHRDDGTFDLYNAPYAIRGALLSEAWSYGMNALTAHPQMVGGGTSAGSGTITLNLSWPPDNPLPPQYFPYTNGASVVWLPYGRSVGSGTNNAQGLIVGWRQIPYATANHQGVFAFGSGTSVGGLWANFVEAHQ